MSDLQAPQSKYRRRLPVAIFFVGFVWFISWAAAKWLIVEAPLDHADAIVVLSGSSTYVERAQVAASLLKEGRASKILLTNDNRQGGWSSAEQRNPFFYERTARELQRQGVPVSDIVVIMQPVASTHDEAARLLEYCSARNLSSIIIVTSPYHSRRALNTFRKAFEEKQIQIGLVHPPTGFQSPAPGRWWLRGRGWQMVPYEYLKLVYYWLTA